MGSIEDPAALGDLADAQKIIAGLGGVLVGVGALVGLGLAINSASAA
ncbi:hypothetical protein ACWDUM_02945 [Rhodococcus sp. NPDC003322]